MKMVYNYREAVKGDIRNYLLNNDITVSEDYDEMYDKLYELLWCEDSVTGNASGSYTFSTWQAEENLCHNFYLLGEALNEFGYNSGNYMLSKGAEWCDVLIRCYLLGDCLQEVMQDIEEYIVTDKNN